MLHNLPHLLTQQVGHATDTMSNTQSLKPGSPAEVEAAPVLNVESPSSDAAPMLDIEPSKGRATPVMSGIKNATLRYDLPTPAVAVRNLVCVSADLLHL